MSRFFNTSGPCVPEDHYMISTAERLADARIHMTRLIEEKRYFVLHAPRQTGKTTAMVETARQITAAGEILALYVNVEAAQALRNDVAAVNEVVLAACRRAALTQLPPAFHPDPACFDVFSMNQGLADFLSAWCRALPRPLVLFLDEVDALIGDGLLSILRQLRAGYQERPTGFPRAVCLIGVRDIRDYRIYSDSAGKYIVGGSAFNIKETSLKLGDFSRAQVSALMGQHTAETGQAFASAALDLIFEKTRGQPWLVNALGRELCFGDPPIADGATVEVGHVHAAVERLILRRDVHLDQLGDKLTEPRVARIIEALLLGRALSDEVRDEDLHYVVDLGLVRQGPDGLEMANPIYREVVPRALTATTEQFLGENPGNYRLPDGRLDLERLLAGLVAFYRRHGDMITARKTYTEAAHHLVFLAWLHRIVNSGGTIEREYAVGLGRMDLHIAYGSGRYAFELKLDGGDAQARGLTQLAGYLDRLGLTEGYLVLFRRTPPTDSADLGRRETVDHQGKRIHILHL